MLFLCSACREKKPKDAFHKNSSSRHGIDTYCKPCRLSYCKSKRTWPTRKEVNTAMVASGFKVCSCCKDKKPLSEFYKSPNVRYGHSAYCRPCNSQKGKDRFASQQGKASVKAYYSQPHVIAREKERKKSSPRHALNINRLRAIKRRPHPDNVTTDDLMGMWERQCGRCAVSGVLMTWNTGKIQPTSISLDRIDSALGYTKDNVRLICYQANTFKGPWTDTEMIEMARAIVQRADERDVVVEFKPHLKLVGAA